MFAILLNDVYRVNFVLSSGASNVKKQRMREKHENQTISGMIKHLAARNFWNECQETIRDAAALATTLIF